MLKNIYNQPITILNKLKRTDSSTNNDVWYKHYITDAAWYTNSEKTATSTSVYIGTYITVLIPFHDDYLPYDEWKEQGKQDTNFTISSGDYVVLGEVNDIITANNIIKVLENYGERVCQVKSHTENHKRFGARVQVEIEGI